MTMTKLTVVTFKWRREGFRTRYEAWHVNRLAAMFRRHLALDHDFACVTDDAAGLDPEIRAIPLWNDHANVPNPHGEREPSCYRRLKLFARESADLIGPRLLACDLDVVLAGDVTHLFDRPEPCVLLTTMNAHIPVNGSLALITPGVHEEIWTSFDPETSPKIAHAAKCWGSDQGWIAWWLRDKVPTWHPGRQGVYFYHMMKEPKAKLPADARFISFHGPSGKPWDARCQQFDWVRQHYGPLPERKAA